MALTSFNESFSADYARMLQAIGSAGCITLLSPDAWRVTEIRQQLGSNGRINLRLYPEQFGFHWCERTGAEWADIAIDWLAANYPAVLSDPNVILSPCNEPDLLVEGYAGGASDQHPHVSIESFRFIWTWQIAFFDRAKVRGGAAVARFGSGPLAGGHEPDGYPPDWEYTMPEFRAVMDRCAVVCLHAYGKSDLTGIRIEQGGYWYGLRHLRPVGYRENVQHDPALPGGPDPGGFCAQYSYKTFFVNEFGNFRHYDTTVADEVANQFEYAYQRYSETGRCAGVTPFIWNSGDEHAANRIARNDKLANRLASMPRYPAAWPPTEEPMWTQDEVWDAVCKAAGAPGYNEANAFAPWVEANPGIDVGIFTSDVQGYDRTDWPYLIQPTTAGCLLYRKSDGAISFAKSRLQVPLA